MAADESLGNQFVRIKANMLRVGSRIEHEGERHEVAEMETGSIPHRASVGRGKVRIKTTAGQEFWLEPTKKVKYF